MKNISWYCCCWKYIGLNSKLKVIFHYSELCWNVSIGFLIFWHKNGINKSLSPLRFCSDQTHDHSAVSLLQF
jgi:hypothetical protein